MRLGVFSVFSPLRALMASLEPWRMLSLLHLEGWTCSVISTCFVRIKLLELTNKPIKLSRTISLRLIPQINWFIANESHYRIRIYFYSLLEFQLKHWLFLVLVELECGINPLSLSPNKVQIDRGRRLDMAFIVKAIKNLALLPTSSILHGVGTDRPNWLNLVT